MRNFVWLSVVAVLATAGTALAVKPPLLDQCPDSVADDIKAQCPCEGRSEGQAEVQAWKNHGKYVSCVVRYRNLLRKSGCLDDEAKRTIARCAARSTCGKEGAVLCCVYDTSATCVGDTLPGDTLADGACSDDALKLCDTDADCAVATGPPRVKRNADRCTERGGTAVGTGSVCGGCPPYSSTLLPQ